MRLVLLAALWLALTSGDPAGWGFGAVVVVLVWVLSARLFPPGEFRLQPLQLPLFLGWFLIRSLEAGWDVSRRLLAPSLPVASGERTVSLTLPEGSPRWLLANLLSLMPGTLSVEFRGAGLVLHCLDTRQDVTATVTEAEGRVARLFGLDGAPWGDV
ncbi:MAG: Na+/H+ antiporter subunit E [Marinobacter sp.]